MPTPFDAPPDVPLCRCGCGQPVGSSKKPGGFAKCAPGHYRNPPSRPVVAPLCACGCGQPTKRSGMRFRRFLLGHSRRRHGFDPKTAKINERLARVYGLTRAEYDRRLEAQGRVCAICRTSEPGPNRTMWCVDHDHSTGAVRGLLCIGCNAGLGNLRDDPEILERAAAYLRGRRSS